MNLRDVYSSKAIALVNKTVTSNKIAPLGAGLFPSQKKAGLDLKWIKTSNGLPVSLAPSNFDAVSTIRSREGFKFDETEMAFFRESMLLKEADRQEILRVQDSTDPYAQTVIDKIFDDANTLVEGADVVAERMRMSLLNPNSSGHPEISISANGATYAYNYDPNGTYATNNYMAITTPADKWNAPTTSDPLTDIDTAIDAVEAYSGTKPAYMIVSKQTMTYLKQNDKVKSAILAQNATANVLITEARVKEIIESQFGIKVIVYAKQYKDEAGNVQKFFKDGYATLIPEGALGKTWYGTTPEEADLMAKADVDVSIVNTGVAVTVSTSNDPVQTKTTVSEILLPSFERMDETYVIKAY